VELYVMWHNTKGVRAVI